jgi:hypothetical protein
VACNVKHIILYLFCRGIDDNGDLPRDFLESIYESISKKEIHMRAEVPQTPVGNDGSGAPSASPGGSSSSAAPANGVSASMSASSVNADGSLDSDGEAAVAAAVGSHWDGVLQRQAAVSAYTPAGGVGAGASIGSGAGRGALGSGGAAVAAAAEVEVADEEAVAHARDMFALIAGAFGAEK